MPNISGAGVTRSGFAEPAALTAESLFERRRSYRTHDVAQARADIERVFFRHALSRTRREDDLQFCHRSARLWLTSFNYICYGSDVEVAVDYIDRDLFVAVLPLSGHAEVEYLGRKTPVSHGQYVVLDPMAPFRWQMSADHCHLAIGVPAELFRESTGAATRRNGLHAWAGGPRPLDERDGGLVDYIAYLCRQLDSPFTYLSTPAVARSVEEAFLTMLLATLRREGASVVCHGAQPVPDVVVAHVKRAEAFVLSNLTEPIRLEDIVAAAGVPTRTLYNGFQRFRGIGPMQWLRVQRLERARLDLADSATDHATTVTEVATRYGATNLGRFAQAYLEQFGELPSETLYRARSLKS